MASARESDILDNFFLQQQEQENWCWASIGVALARFLKGQERIQCALVQTTLRPPGLQCCNTPDHPDCDKVARISAVLGAINVRRRTNPPQPQQTLSLDEIKRDIASNRPIICLMVGESDHYVVIVGWFMRDEAAWLWVDDPAVGGRKEVSFADFFEFEGRVWDQSTRLA